MVVFVVAPVYFQEGCLCLFDKQVRWLSECCWEPGASKRRVVWGWWVEILHFCCLDSLHRGPGTLSARQR